MDTLWSKVRYLYTSGRYDWTIGSPFVDLGLRNGLDVRCLCTGGAIAQVLTGNPDDMYRPFPDIEAALAVFADHVGANFADGVTTAERVYKWNDALPHRGGKDDVLAALAELHTIAVTECQHRPRARTLDNLDTTGVCLYCGREVL